MEIFCKHGRHFSIIFPSKSTKEEASGIISTYAFPMSVHQLFAFVYNAFDDGYTNLHFKLDEGNFVHFSFLSFAFYFIFFFFLAIILLFEKSNIETSRFSLFYFIINNSNYKL